MVLGEKLWEGKGKSAGPGFIKYVGAEGVASMYSWNADLKGMGRAKDIDLSLHATGKSWMRPKGLGKAKTQGVFMTKSGDMGVLKGSDLSKMTGTKPGSVGLFSMMTMSEKLSWINEVIAIIAIEALDPMWEQFNITIYEWK